MNAQPEKRLLAAILNADVAGYTKLMADDETATFTDLEQRRDIFRRHVEVRGGTRCRHDRRQYPRDLRQRA